MTLTPNKKNKIDHSLSVAPMMDCTDRHDRYFLRLITKHTVLYTEMITALAVIHGRRDYLLGFDETEHPLAVQLAGSEPEALAQAARIVTDFGYDEINLNIGCPSDRVQSGRFGACLMLEPQLVGECISAIKAKSDLRVSIKCRIGVDDQDGEESLDVFVKTIAKAGAKTIIVHARKAWLEGLSPKENRSVPPLDYERVVRLKANFPDLEIILNGGIESLDQAQAHSGHLDGVMIGRAAYHNPYMLVEADQRFFNSQTSPPSRAEIVESFLPYVERQLSKGVPLHAMTRHILGLFQNQPGAKAWRRHISEHAHKKGASAEIITQAIALVQSEISRQADYLAQAI